MGVLVEEFVQITAKGVEGVFAAFDKAKGAVKEVKKGIEEVGKGLSAIGGVGMRAFGFATAMTAIANPVQFERLGMAFRDLSAVVGFMFAPAIENVIQIIYRVADAIYNLSPKTQEQIVHWAKYGITASFVAMAIGKVVPVIGLLTTVLGGLRTVFMGISIATGGIVPLLGLVAGAVLAIFGASQEAGGGLGGLMTVFKDIGQAFKPIMDAVSELWVEIQPVIAELGEAFKELIVALMPILKEIVKAVAWFIQAMIPPIKTAISWITEIVRKLADIVRWVGVHLNIVDTSQAEAAGQGALPAPNTTEQQRRSAFGAGGGGRGGLGDVTSGWRQALEASMKGPLNNIEDHTRRLVDIEEQRQQVQVTANPNGWGSHYSFPQ